MGGYRDMSVSGSDTLSVSTGPCTQKLSSWLYARTLPAYWTFNRRCSSIERELTCASLLSLLLRAQPPSSRHYTPTATARGSLSPSIAPSASEQYNLPSDPTYWAQADDVEADGSSFACRALASFLFANLIYYILEYSDYLHNPDSLHDAKRRSGTIFTPRGMANLGCLGALILALLMLFVRCIPLLPISLLHTSSADARTYARTRPRPAIQF